MCSRPRHDPSAAWEWAWLRWGWVLVAGVAVGVRVWHVWAVSGPPLGDALVQDARYYQEEALRLLGRLPGAGAAGPTFMNLGYPYFLASFYAVTGVSVRGVLWLQALLGTASSLLLAVAARRLLASELAGLLAGLLYAADGVAVFYDGLLLTPSLTNFLLASALAAFAFAAGSPSRRNAAALMALAGLAVGGAALLRASMLLLVPAVAGLLSRYPEGPSGLRSGRRFEPAAAFLLGAVLLPMPVILYNGIAHGEWVPISANGGMNFWVGNHGEAEGVYAAAPFLDAQNAAGEERQFHAEARRRTGQPALSLSGASRFWLREGLREIGADPGRWLRLTGRKLALFANRFEVNTNVGMRFVSRFSPVLGWLPIGFGVLAVLGVPGILALALEPRPLAAWAAAVLVLVPLLTCVLFFVSGEYRHPASLGLALGAAGLAHAWRRRGEMTRRPTRMFVVFSVVAVALGAAVWPYRELELGCHPFYDASNYVRELAAAPGRPATERAEAILERFTGEDGPRLVLDEARFELRVRVAMASGREEDLIRALEAALPLRAADLGEARESHSEGFLRHVARRVPAALAELAAKSGIAAGLETRRELALLGADDYRDAGRLFEAGRPQEALSFLRTALERAPHDVRLQAMLGQGLLVTGSESEGLAWLDKSLEGWPELPDAAYYAGAHAASRGRLDLAREALREALRRDPGFEPARRLLRQIEDR